jgi:hypothetical protein
LFTAPLEAVPSSSATPSAEMTGRLRGAQKAIVGKVIGVRPRLQRNEWGDQLIVSRLTVAIDEHLKGGGTERTADVDVEGGTLNGLTLHVGHQPALDTGDRTVLLLDAGPGGVWVPHHKALGVLKVDSNERIAGSSLRLADVRDAARAARQ